MTERTNSSHEAVQQCELCMGQKFVHYHTGWKHTAWPCPQCNKESFYEVMVLLKIKNPEGVIQTIKTLGKPGSG